MPRQSLPPVLIGLCAVAIALLSSTGCSTSATGHGAPAPASSAPTTPTPTVPAPNPAYPTATAGSTGGPPVRVRLRVGQRLAIQGEKGVGSPDPTLLVKVSDNLFQAVRPGHLSVQGAADVPPPPCASKGCSYARPGQAVQISIVR